MTVEDVAEICHEANRTLCERQGDWIQKPWAEAADWQKESAINGVQFHLDNLDATPEDSHENWMKEKAAAGWTYGAEKDPEAKKHPCFRPYSELPTEQQAKDYLFRAIVHGLAPFIE